MCLPGGLWRKHRSRASEPRDEPQSAALNSAAARLFGAEIDLRSEI